jgi:hypothetical protein
LGLAVLLKPTTIVRYVELVLKAAAISRDAHNIVDLDVRGVSEVDGLLHWELVGDPAEVNYFL